jgi:hypothetical protein
MPEYTTTDTAALLGVNRRNVQNYCKRHGLKKFGREYVVTDQDMEGMRNELGKVGRKARLPTNSPTNSKIDQVSDEDIPQ